MDGVEAAVIVVDPEAEQPVVEPGERAEPDGERPAGELGPASGARRPVGL
jgi:hypothetical protein